MKNSDPGRALPPDIWAAFTPDEIDAHERVWMEASGCDVDIPDLPPGAADEAWITQAADEMRVALRTVGALPAAKSKARIFALPFRQARLYQLHPWKGYTAIAACVAILLAIGITVDSNTIEAPFGEQVTHTLSDGSTMLLNSGTRIRIAPNYNKNARSIRIMRGEVLFDVEESDALFAVHTPHGEINVVGTTFNVRYWPSDAENGTDVAVESGLVLVRSKSGDEIALAAGEAVRLGKGGRTYLAKSSTDAENLLSWPRSSFKFSDHSTGDILEELERRYDIDIQVGVEDMERTRSGILLENPEGPEQILDDLCELHGCTYTVDPDGRAFRITPL